MTLVLMAIIGFAAGFMLDAGVAQLAREPYEREAEKAEAQPEHTTLGLDIQDYLLTQVNARLEYMAPVRRRIVWGYVRNSKLPIWYGANQYLADVWIDTAHPSWRPPKPDAEPSPTPGS